jgi:hypothetical protein
VPVVRNVEAMNYADIERAIAELGEKARQGALAVEDMDGGTFTISNGGVFGSLLGTPIINPPQSAILGMHSIQERPVAIKGQVSMTVSARDWNPFQNLGFQGTSSGTLFTNLGFQRTSSGTLFTILGFPGTGSGTLFSNLGFFPEPVPRTLQNLRFLEPFLVPGICLCSIVF